MINPIFKSIFPEKTDSEIADLNNPCEHCIDYFYEDASSCEKCIVGRLFKIAEYAAKYGIST